MMQVLATGGLSTVQDVGRHGYRRFGVGVSGALDTMAARAGNAMLGNDTGAAFIEIALFPFRVRFEVDTVIAVTGGAVGGTIDDAPMWPWWCLPVRAGQTLSLAAPPEGGIGYLCVRGGVDVPRVLGSCSTELKGGFGGFQGRPLKRGDRLPIGIAAPWPRQRGPRGFGIRPQCVQRGEPTELRALPAAEWALLDADAQAVFQRQAWTIHPHSNRQGVRLDGPALPLENRPELLSHGIVPGVVQLPPSGLPIVMQCDAQTAGGYPKLATVIEADQWRLAQTPVGASVRFRLVTLEDALQADAAMHTYLERVRLAARQSQ